MTRTWILAGLAAVAVAGCAEEERGVGLGPISGEPLAPPAAEVIDLSLPAARPIPSYSIAVGSGPEAAVAYGGDTLSMPQSNLVLESNGETYLLRQVAVGRENYVVVEGGAAPSGTIMDEIRRRSGCLPVGVPTVVRQAGGGGAVVYQVDCR